MKGMHLVWFKRDLRTHDHAPLLAAARSGPVLPLFVFEPELWQQPDMSGQHAAFVLECLADLNAELTRLGAPLHWHQGDLIAHLNHLHRQQRILGLYSHAETGNLWTYARDLAVARWCQDKGIPWHEWRQDGVVRRLSDRNGWAQHWENFFAAPPQPKPDRLNPALPGNPARLPSLSELILTDPDDKPQRQPGGSQRAQQLLHSFLHRRGESYRYAMSSPNTAPRHCSRLSPHLAWGSLSLRQVVHDTRAQQTHWHQQPPQHPLRQTWLKSLQSFDARLHWHCHFMQKLETQPCLQTHNLHPALDQLDRKTDNQRLQAFCLGQTGFPFIDACIRRLLATGWINFRMRAMLVSFATNLLWLPWQPVAQFLARQFTDYEPGIHYPQVQMQAGTTGMNTLRLYNPVKQSLDQDPRGHFIRQWLPELSALPDDYLHTPWQLTSNLQQRYSMILDSHYPRPIIDHQQAARQAKSAIYALRAQPENRAITRQLLDRHGSRKPASPRPPRRKTPQPTPQLSLDL